MAVDQIKRLYESMPAKLDRARKRFGRPLTLAEKILVSHADNFDTQEWSRGKAQLRLRVDGAPFASKWEAHINRLFAWYDRDNNRTLDKDEAVQEEARNVGRAVAHAVKELRLGRLQAVQPKVVRPRPK